MEGIISRGEGITPRIGAAGINSAGSQVGEERIHVDEAGAEAGETGADR